MSSTYEKHLQQKLLKTSEQAKAVASEMEEKFKTENEVPSELQEKFEKLIEAGRSIREEIEKLNGLKEMDDFLTEPKGRKWSDEAQIERRTIGEQFVASDSYKNALKGKGSQIRAVHEAKGFFNPAERKATFTGADLDTRLPYVGSPVLLEQQPLKIRDLLSVGQTTLATVPYIKEDTYTNAADAVLEEGEKPEATFDLSDVTAPVRKIAVTARVSDEMWNDFVMLRDYINNRLRFMVGSKEDSHLLTGSGSSGQIRGILNTSGIQTQAKSSDTVPDAIYKAITKVRSVGFFEPDGLVIHPNDWEAVRLLKDGNSQYYGGGPFSGAYGNGGMAPDMLWGLPVCVTTAVTENTALVGSFRLGAQIWQREGIMVESTNSHEDDFQYNRMAIRVEERLALAVYRPLAFCTVTGI